MTSKTRKLLKSFCVIVIAIFLIWNLLHSSLRFDSEPTQHIRDEVQTYFQINSFVKVNRNVSKRKDLNISKDIIDAVGADEWICKTITDSEKKCPAITKEESINENGNLTRSCNIPELNPFHPSVLRLFTTLPKPQCSTQISYGKLADGKLSFISKEIVSATYRRIVRSGDYKFVLGTPTSVENSKKITDEFFEVQFTLQNGESVKEIFFQPVPHEHLMKRKGTKTPGIPLNILIIGVDSLSHANAKRTIPKVYELLKKELGAVIFNGHSVVGDGTTEQLTAMLTGKSQLEQHEKIRNRKPVDGWSWIYKQLKENGYLTGYSGDCPLWGPFQWRLVGFTDPPTDLYTRPFFLAWEKYGWSEGRNKCLASRTISKSQFDYVGEVFEMFPEKLKFFFSFNVAYSHNSNNEAGMIEPDLLSFLKYFRDEGHLNNTLLIIMGDHGARYDKIRVLLQGKLEERLPFLSMTFPPWFMARYPNISNNLRLNADRLTSWYDVYATFRHMLSFPEVPSNVKHGKSLLQEIPLLRTCADASIEVHWCPCLQMSPVSVKHSHLKNAAMAAVEYMNTLIDEHKSSSEYCQMLYLKNITYALIERANDKVLSYKLTIDAKPVFAANSIPARESYCRYQLQLTTSPNNGIYEVTVKYYNGYFMVSKSISRVNKYGDQPECIATDLPHLRKFCMCEILS